MTFWCASYSQPCFIPTPAWWYLIAQDKPNGETFNPEVSVYLKTKKGQNAFISPDTAGKKNKQVVVVKKEHKCSKHSKKH